MRVLFFGQTGINKRQCVESLATHTLQKDGFPPDLEHSRSMGHLRVFHLEDEISNQLTGGDYISYLDSYYSRSQTQVWQAAWDEVMRKVDESGAEHVFVTLHASYFRRNRFFSVATIEKIREFQATTSITLIDDAHECWERVRERETRNPRGTTLRLRDVFLWRTVESMVAEFVTSGTGSSHFIVAAKHPVEMVRRLVFEGHQRKRIYASFPITSTRGYPETRGLIDDFRQKLHSRFTVFDPLTIDERSIRAAYNGRPEVTNEVVVTDNDRWPLGFVGNMKPMIDSSDLGYPIRIPVGQVAEVIEDIERQIEARDFRLIDQVQALAAFRPNFKKHFSRGVHAELIYAGQTATIPVHSVWDEAEDGEFSDSPFAGAGTHHDNTDALIAALGG